MIVGRFKKWDVVISGGATGAGGASSELFAKEGAQIAIVDINEDAAQRTAEQIRQQGGRAFVTVADVTRASDLEKAASQILDIFNGRVDSLFNHVGTVIVTDFLDTDEVDWDFMMNVNVKFMFLMTKALLPALFKLARHLAF